MRLLAVFLMLVSFPLVCAQEGLFVSRHNVTYTLDETGFFVEEVIVFENVGSAEGNLFRDNIYFTRGDARSVEVEVSGDDTEYSVEQLPSTAINIALLLWKGEQRVVTIRYRRSDMLFKEDTVNVLSGLALGQYTWITDRATVKFIAPEGHQFGNVTPYVTKTLEDGKEVLVYDIAPLNIESLNAIKEGLPVRIEYAEYDEMTISEMKTAGEFIEEAESDIENANNTVENAISRVSDTTQVLMLYELASATLHEAKNALELAEIKSSPYSAEYSPYEAYHHARESKSLARNASRQAEESKDLANYEIQRTLEDRISGIGSKILGQLEGEETSRVIIPGPSEEARFLMRYWFATLLILAAIAIFGIYRYIVAGRGPSAAKRDRVKDFRSIDELKHKTFEGFDKKLDNVKHGTGLAAEIRDLRRKKEKLEFDAEKLQRKKEAENMLDHVFEQEKKKLDSQIQDTAADIDRLQTRLKEIKKVKK